MVLKINLIYLKSTGIFIKKKIDKKRFLNYYLNGGRSMTSLEKLEELIYKGFKETDHKFQETDRKFRETARVVKETDLQIQKLSREVGKIHGSLGRFAENMVAPAVVKLFNERGIPITDYAQRVYSPGRRIEFDIVAFNKDYVVVVSVKMTLEVSDVKEFVNERLPIFKELFPRYKDMKVIGAVAGANIVGESDRYAVKRGLYVFMQSGENITMLNDKTFKAKIF
jgi:hypothetical protein